MKEKLAEECRRIVKMLRELSLETFVYRDEMVDLLEEVGRGTGIVDGRLDGAFSRLFLDHMEFAESDFGKEVQQLWGALLETRGVRYPWEDEE